jgi:hypothetical protein
MKTQLIKNKNLYLSIYILFFLLGPIVFGSIFMFISYFTQINFPAFIVELCYYSFVLLTLALWGYYIYKKTDYLLIDDIHWFVLMFTFALAWANYYQKFPATINYCDFFGANEWHNLSDIFPNLIIGIFISLVTYIITVLLKHLTEIQEGQNIYKKFIPELRYNVEKVKEISNEIIGNIGSIDWLTQIISLEEQIKKNNNVQVQNAFDKLFHPSLNNFLENITGQIAYDPNKNKDQYNVPAVCLLASISTYLDYESEMFNTKQKFIYTNFGCYGQICQKIIDHFHSSDDNIQFHTLLILEPKCFFNNNKKEQKFTPEWKRYIDYYFKNKPNLIRYFFVNGLNNDSFQVNIDIVSEDTFNNQLNHFINLNSLYDFKERVPLNNSESFNIINRNKSNDKNFIKVQNALKEFHKGDNYFKKIVLSENSQISKYYYNNDLKTYERIKMPLDYFAVKNQNNEYIFAIIVENVDDSRDMVKLSIYHDLLSDIELLKQWKALKEFFNIIELDSISINE